MAQKGEVLVTLHGLSGNIYSELPCDIGLSIEEIKKMFLPVILPDASPDAKLTLFFDGNEVEDGQTLAKIGIDVEDQAHFTALMYDPRKLVMMEINKLRRESIEASHREAAAARKHLLERRQQLISQRRKEVESAYAARCDEPQGPLLMLADEPANLPASPDHPHSVLMPSNQPSNQQGGAVASDVLTSATPNWRTRANEVAMAYDSFFDHISFRKGWKQLPFTRHDVEATFPIAARIVALARTEILDVRDEGIKLRQVEGSARDWMHSSECPQLLRSSPDEFVCGLVHATFQDANGYVEGLDKSEVDRFIATYYTYSSI
jgi:hypothetical protein